MKENRFLLRLQDLAEEYLHQREDMRAGREGEIFIPLSVQEREEEIEKCLEKLASKVFGLLFSGGKFEIVLGV